MLNKEKREKNRAPVNFIAVAILIAIVFWFLEGVLHGLIFKQPFFWNEIFPQAHELWMRILVIGLIISFGVFSQLVFKRFCLMKQDFNLSEQRYAVLFKKAPVAITLVNTEGMIIDCNQTTELLTGYTRDELIGKKFDKLDTLNPEDIAMLRENLDLVGRGRDIPPYELKIIRKNGETRWVNVVNSVMITDGAVQGIQVMATDITTMKTADMVRRKYENEKDLVLNTTKHLIIYYNKESEIIWANKMVLDILEKDLEDIVGRRCQVVWLHSEEMCKDCSIKKVFETNEAQFCERRKPDGSWWSVSGYPVRSDSGELIGVVEVTRDITVQKKAEQDIKTSEIRLRSVIDSLPFDMFMIDKNGYYVMQNVACRKRWGDIVGKRPSDVADNEETRKLWEDNKNRAFAGETVHGEQVFTLRNKQIRCYVIIVPIWEGDEVQNILGVNIDTSQLNVIK